MRRSAAPPTPEGGDGRARSRCNASWKPPSTRRISSCAADLRDRERKLRKTHAEQQEKRLETSRAEEETYVTEEDIAQVVAMWTGIPADADRRRRVRATAEDGRCAARAHHRPGRGDHHAFQGGAPRARRSQGPASARSARFIFLGPTGVGKTVLAKALAEFMFGSEDALIKIDMSEFMERHDVARLVGAPPGYVGYEEGGQLTEAVRRKSLLGHPARRNREGAPRSVQHAPPDHGGRQSGGRQGPQGRLPQHDHHHDLQRRRRADHARYVLWLQPSRKTRTRRQQREYDQMQRQGDGRSSSRPSGPSSSTGSTRRSSSTR